MTKTILLLHGALGAADYLTPLAEHLKTLGFQPHVFTLSGHGQVPFSKDGFSVPVFAKELEVYIREHQLEGAALFGYSMGGYIGLHLAAQQSGLLSRIITLGSKLEWSPEIAAREIKQLDPEVIQAKVPAFAQTLEKRHADWKALMKATALLMQDLGEHPYLNEAVYQAIDIPVLLGLGDRDAMVSVAETTQALKALPKASMYMLPQTKHPIEVVDLQQLSFQIQKFLV